MIQRDLKYDDDPRVALLKEIGRAHV